MCSCGFNGIPACSPAIPLAAHLQVCPLRSVSGACTQGCGLEIRSTAVSFDAKMEQHVVHACPLNWVSCPLGCDANRFQYATLTLLILLADLFLVASCMTHCLLVILAAFNLYPLHTLCFALLPCCLLRLTVVVCNSRADPAALEKHVKHLCPHRLLLCTLECGAQIRANKMAYHLKNDCPNRLAPCTYGCGITGFLVSNILEHMTGHCPRRVVECSQCDIQGLLARDQQQHETLQCNQRKTACDLGCGQLLRQNDFERIEHQRTECPRRLADCPGRCGVVGLMVEDVTLHKVTACAGDSVLKYEHQYDPDHGVLLPTDAQHPALLLESPSQEHQLVSFSLGAVEQPDSIIAPAPVAPPVALSHRWGPADDGSPPYVVRHCKSPPTCVPHVNKKGINGRKLPSSPMQES